MSGMITVSLESAEVRLPEGRIDPKLQLDDQPHISCADTVLQMSPSLTV